MTRLAVFVLLAAALPLLAAPVPKELKKVMKIEGTWKMVSCDCFGRPAQLNADQHWTFDAGLNMTPHLGSKPAPDAVFIHTSGKRIYLELLGYWTPRYLNDKLQELARDKFSDFLLPVSEEMRCSRDALTTTPSNVLLYKSALKWKDILRKLTELQ